MKIEIVINSRRYREHKKIADIFVKVFKEKEYDSIIVDLGTDISVHEKSQMIKQEHPHLLITLDMAGFELRTTLEHATYNVMPYRMAHILPGEYTIYSKWLRESMNFSMFFYASDKTAEEIKKNHPEIENVSSVDAFSNPGWWDDDNKVHELVDIIVKDTEIELDF